MNFQRISTEFQSLQLENHHEVLRALFICVYGYSNNPLGFCFFHPKVPGPGQRGEAVVDRPFPGEGLTGGEGRGVWELHWFKAHLRVVLGCGEGLGGGGSTEQAGRRRRQTTEAELR